MIRRMPFAFATAILCATSLLAGIATADAASSSKKARPRPATVQKDAAYVVDGATGQVLYDRNADAPRKPASLTKMMTLYLMFEELDKGRIKLDTKLTASLHASRQDPTKVGIEPGGQIDAETAIKALTVLSANDVAVVIAETIGGTEENFARRMTQRAHELGMTKSNFQNASGLPNPLQVTSAHDMALLGRHLAYDFPKYYVYFAAPSFSYQGRTHLTHDHLLDNFQGVDGIKTGYTRASGFNLVTSAVRNNKHVVGVVMGGLSYASRDKEMVRLLSGVFDAANGTPEMLADANPPWLGGKGPAENPFRARTGTAYASLNLDTVPVAKPAQRKAAPPAAKPAPKPVRLASLPKPKAKPERAAPAPVMVAEAPAPKIPSGKFIGIPFALVPDDAPAPNILVASVIPLPRERPAKPVLQGDITGLSTLIAAAKARTPTTRKQWAVQIGAFANETLAASELAAHAGKGGSLLENATHIVEVFESFDGHKLYRARFGTFAENEAKTVCSEMMKRGQQCFATVLKN